MVRVEWNSSKTEGKVTIHEEDYAVIKTPQGQVLTGKLEQGNRVFRVFNVNNGKPTGAIFHNDRDRSGWMRGLMGGGRGGGGAGPSAANQNVNTIAGSELGGGPANRLDELPPNVLAEIFNHLDPAGRKALLSANKHLREVLRLEIPGLRVSGAKLKDAITKFPNAKSITIKGKLTSDQLAALANAKQLEHLDLRKCRGLTPELLQQLSEIPKIQQLKKLSMRIPVSELEGTLQKLPKVTELSLVGPMTQEQVALLVQAEKLEVLDLRKCTGLTNEMLESLSGVRAMSILLDAPNPFANGHGGLALELLHQQAQALPAPLWGRFWASFPYTMVIGVTLGAATGLWPLWHWLKAKNSTHPS